MIIWLLVTFILFQAFILFCCLAAGNDPLSQNISDEEQMEYIRVWMEKHKGKHS